MTAPSFVAVAAVRDYLTLNTDGTSRYSDGTIGSNIRAASAFLERATHRYFEARSSVTLTYTTNGAAVVDLPGVRTVASVTQAGATLTANETYWLLADDRQSGVYTAIQLRAFTGGGRDWYKAIPEWFDRNLDSPYYPGNYGPAAGSLPNDLVIVADVGYSTLPEELLLATKLLAAWYTVRPHALLSGATSTPDGLPLDLDSLPPEVAQFITDWRIGTHMVVSL